MRRALATAALVAAALVLSGHIGDNNTHYRGPAGPYTVQVVVRHPGVVPGLADISVRVEGAPVDRVAVQPVRWDVGIEGAPRPDDATPVPGEPGLYSAELWLMTAGSYSVNVYVEGDRGAGTAVVPVMSMATRQLEMGEEMATLLLALGLLLAVGLATIVRAAVRESVIPPGAEPDPRRRRRARIATGVAVVLIALTVTGGKAWWNAEDAAYGDNLFEPLDVVATARADAGQRVLDLTLVDPEWLARRWTPLVTDHGKLMHAFLVRLPEMDAFAHVHPVPLSSDSFRLALPPLPAGDYRIYADVTHESGFTQTLTDTVAIPTAATDAEPDPDAAGRVTADADDSWWVAGPAGPAVPAGSTPSTATFEDGTTLVWERPPGPLVEERDLELRFRVGAPDGSPARLEPYMGMVSHAAVRRADGSVFVHLHPVGSISTAAQAQLRRTAMDSASLANEASGEAGPAMRDHEGMAMPGAHQGMAMGIAAASDVVSVPYAFPRAGPYRLWIQVKRDGRVYTAAFDLTVQPEG